MEKLLSQLNADDILRKIVKGKKKVKKVHVTFDYNTWKEVFSRVGENKYKVAGYVRESVVMRLEGGYGRRSPQARQLKKIKELSPEERKKQQERMEIQAGMMNELKDLFKKRAE